MVIRSSTINGIRRIVSRETTRETTTARTRLSAIAGIRAIAPSSTGDRSRTATVPATMGAPYASTRIPADSNGRDCHDTSVRVLFVVATYPPPTDEPTVRPVTTIRALCDADHASLPT
jgi:hypothetical protein